MVEGEGGHCGRLAASPRMLNWAERGDYSEGRTWEEYFPRGSRVAVDRLRVAAGGPLVGDAYFIRFCRQP